MCNKAILVQIDMFFAIFIRGLFLEIWKKIEKFRIFFINSLGYSHFTKVHDFANNLKFMINNRKTNREQFKLEQF